MGELELGQVFIGEINVDKIGDKNVCKLFDVSLVYMEEFKMKQNAYKLKFKKSGNMRVMRVYRYKDKKIIDI